METFGERLSRLMEKESMTVRNAAEIAQVAASTLQEWRANASPSDFQAVRRLAEHFKVSMAYLLTGEDDSPHKKQPDVADVFLVFS